jgi:hypothetical protein
MRRHDPRAAGILLLAAVLPVRAAEPGKAPAEAVPAPPIPALPAHPRLLFHAKGLEALKARIAGHDWAKAQWETVRARADAWAKEIDAQGGAPELPPRGANWYHWYICPKHGAGLERGAPVGPWQWEHRCTVDKAVFRGDPAKPETDYDGCALATEHGRRAGGILDLGIAYRVTGERRYAEKARALLLAYAGRYLDYPLHTIRGEAKIGGGRVGSQTLDESTWLIPVCQGADLVWDALPEADRETVAAKLILPAAKEVILPHRLGVHNIQCWKNSAVGLAGFLLGDEALIRAAIHDPDRGYWTQVRKGVLADGTWWEGAWGYHFYTVSAIGPLTEAARNCGIDLYGPEYRRMFEAPLALAMPNLRLPAFSDSAEVDLKGRAAIYELAFARYADPRFALLPAGTTRKNDPALWFGADALPKAEDAPLRSRFAEASGCAILARGAGEAATWLALRCGPHGGGHGHPDKLGVQLYARGLVLAPDAGITRYGSPLHAGWYKTTLAHNTLVVDETSQQPAEGRCLAFGSAAGADVVMADAGAIDKRGVRFVRTAALLDEGLVVVLDQVRCDRERTLDVAVHLRGAWEGLPAGEAWLPPAKEGYRYLMDATTRPGGDGASLAVKVRDDWRAALALAGGAPTEVITATGIGAHAGDRVPVALLRRRAQSTAYAWAIALDGKAPELAWLPVAGADGGAADASVAAAVRVARPGGKTWHVAANPEKRAMAVKLKDGTTWAVGEAYGVR